MEHPLFLPHAAWGRPVNSALWMATCTKYWHTPPSGCTMVHNESWHYAFYY